MTALPIRQAHDGDQTVLGEIWQAARERLEDVRGGAALMAAETVTTTRGPVMTWVVGEDEIAGTVSAWLEGDVGWMALWVTEAMRSRGVGRQLAHAALDWLADAGASEFDALALPGDRATKQLFESLGFKARLLVMRREAPPA